MKNLTSLKNTALITLIALFTFSLNFAATPVDHREARPDTTVSEAPGSLQVAQAVTCTAIDNREPVGTASTFSNDVGRIYCYSAITLPKGEISTIQHVWKLEGKVISTVELDVQGPRWRTRSYKTITPKMAGNWTVEITAGGNVLETLSFTVK
ncbi:MAG: DUF2914 domain-containing protein [Bacteroidota bacterium]